MDSIEGRVSRIEGTLEHLATKADLEKMQVNLTRWTVGTIVTVGTLAVVAIELLGG